MLLLKYLKMNMESDADQKKIDYWEKTDNEFPPFFKNDNLEICAEIFAEKGFDFLTYELRDNIGQDFVSKNVKNGWLILLEKIKMKC